MTRGTAVLGMSVVRGGRGLGERHGCGEWDRGLEENHLNGKRVLGLEDSQGSDQCRDWKRGMGVASCVGD